jgi:hypothetical protein
MFFNLTCTKHLQKVAELELISEIITPTPTRYAKQ